MAGLIDARVKTTIKENEYDILPHPATEGVTLAFKIAALLDAINAEKALFTKNEDGTKEVDPLQSMKVAGSICKKIITDDPKLTMLLDLFKYTQVNGATLNKDRFDNHFGGNYGELAEAVMEVISANNFLEMASLFGPPAEQ